MTYSEERIIVSVPSSFVANKLKIANETGSGEAKLFIGSTNDPTYFDKFFSFDEGYTYRFDKDNLMNYLYQVKIEYVFQFFNKYKEVDINLWENNFSKISTLEEKQLCVSLGKFYDEKNRYYIKEVQSKVFKNVIRNLILPKITLIVFEKDSENKVIKLLLEVDYKKNFDYTIELSNLEVEKSWNATNELFYGVPGSGKSYKINQICNKQEFIERVVFHPDYSNADFIGQIMPVLQDEDNKLKYEFIPGPFSNILKRAMEDHNNMYYLIIEEINRGNAAAIFGDIFQLLDRDENGKSKYCINNYYIADYVYGNKIDKIYLPSNLTIYATMNSSDQNVFTLDTAFQRRWIMRNVPNVFEGEQARCLIGGSDIRWGAFATAVNNRLQESNIGLLSTEDKGLGAYFVNKAEIEDIEKFAEKVFKYLWDDAFKMNRADLFKENFKTLSDILNVCKNEDKGILEKILVKDVYDKMKLLNSEFSSEVTEV